MSQNLTFPSIYLLPGRLPKNLLEELQKQIPSLTTDASEADIFLGKLSNKERAQFELRRLGISTVEVRKPGARTRSVRASAPTEAPAAKRRKLGSRSPSPIVISSSSEDEGVQVVAPPEPTLRLVKLAWFTDSVAKGKVLPLDDYTIYEGRRVRPEPAVKSPAFSSQVPFADGILKRAQADAAGTGTQSSQRPPPNSSSPFRSPHRKKFDTVPPIRPSLVRQTTSENDKVQDLPPIPDFLHTIYSCQRPTPLNCPNEEFVDALKTIRVARQLTGDRIGIRAYSTAIATIAAYPYELSTPIEVSRLPGCGPKIAELFREFQNNGGHVREADNDEFDAKLSILRLFYNIWGVAEATARSFYNKGWRDLDDVIEYGWKELSRVQQIGVKYYDELQDPLARVQVETIANRVLQHANKLQNGFQMVIAGGYRRGKELSGDVDIIISHPDESATHLLIRRLVLSLEEAELVTHTLTLSTANSERGQEAVSWKGNAANHNLDSQGGGSGGAGFDTLDKALVVWQEPMEEENDDDDDDKKNKGGEETDDEKRRKNTNPHRRVDIIISPWKTVGCAVLGWSSGTTFQRDLRRYCKYEKNLRFDSSGARSRTDGSMVDLEDFYGGDPAPDMLTAERRVFDALGLEFRPPNERCTG